MQILGYINSEYECCWLRGQPLRMILEIHPTLANQLQKIYGHGGYYGYNPLKCSSFKVFSDYEFPSVKEIEFFSLPDEPITGLPKAVICFKDTVINEFVCKNVLNGMKKIQISNSKVEYIPTCKWIRFKRCEFNKFDQEHEQNGLVNDSTKSIGFVDCGGEFPSITFKALTSISVDGEDYKVFKLNNCLFPKVVECVLNNCPSFDTSKIPNVKKLSIRGDTPSLETCDNLESFSLHGPSTKIFKNDIKNFKTKKLVIDFDHDKDWYPSYKVEQLANIDTSKLKSISIIGAKAIGDIGPLKRKFEDAGVESCIITTTLDILKKTKTT